MLEDNINKIKKLSEIQIEIYNFKGAIYSRENEDIVVTELEKMKKYVDNVFSELIIDNAKFEMDKLNIINKYKKILKTFMQSTDFLFVTILKKYQFIETNQNIILAKKFLFEYFKELLENTTDLEKIEKLKQKAKNEKISLDNLDEKIKNSKNKVLNYEKALKLCEKEFKVCEYTRNVEIEKLMDWNLNIEDSKDKKMSFLNKKSINEEKYNHVLNLINEFLEDLEINKIKELKNNIENYALNFSFNIENQLTEISQN